MRIIDNSPIDEPCIGKLIEETCSVGQFSDNCIYLIADEDSSLAKEAVSWMEQLNARKEAYFNTYDLEVVQNVELKNHPKIRERIEQNSDNLLIQLSTPAEQGKKFIVAKTDESHLLNDLFLMVYAAERITKHNLAKILKDFVKDNTDEFIELAKNAIQDKGFQSRYFVGLADMEAMRPSFGMAVSTAKLMKRLDKQGSISHQNRMEMYDHFLDNLKTYHKTHDPKVAAELDFVISIIDPVTLRYFFLKQSPRLQEKFNNHINPRRMAEVSTMDLEVRKAASVDKTRKNDGHYRLFLVREYETLMVHFSRKNGFILYLIYLLDRKKNGDKVDTLNLSKYKELFGKLYHMVYGINGETIFADMMKNYNADNEVQQKGLYTVLKSIRDDIGSTCERMQEPADPFLLRDIASHLAVLPEHIILPDEMMALI